jgi:hypothetical protein
MTTVNMIGTVGAAWSSGPTLALPIDTTTSGASVANSAAYLRVAAAIFGASETGSVFGLSGHAEQMLSVTLEKAAALLAFHPHQRTERSISAAGAAAAAMPVGILVVT